MHGIAAQKITEAHDQFDFIVFVQTDYVFPAEFDIATRDCVAISSNDPKFFQVNVDGMLPPAAVPQDPPLRRIPLHRKAELRAIHESPVDHPLTVDAVKVECASDANAILLCGCVVRRERRQADRSEDAIVRTARHIREGHWLGVEAGIAGRRGAHNLELHEGISSVRLSRIQETIIGSKAAVLVQEVL